MPNNCQILDELKANSIPTELFCERFNSLTPNAKQTPHVNASVYEYKAPCTNLRGTVKYEQQTPTRGAACGQHHSHTASWSPTAKSPADEAALWENTSAENT